MKKYGSFFVQNSCYLAKIVYNHFIIYIIYFLIIISMGQINHFAETNVDDKLKSMISECIGMTSLKISEAENVILQLPICARAPLLALYFVKIRGIEDENSKKFDRFAVLIKLFQIAVRIYERHVLGGASNRFIGTDRFDNKKVKQLVENLGVRQQTNTFKLDSAIDNDPYYKEVLYDLKHAKQCNFVVKATISDYFVKKVMQFVALYAQDVQKFYSVRANSSVCDEQLYKQSWSKYKLLTVRSLFFPNDLEPEELSEFFENYSLR